MKKFLILSVFFTFILSGASNAFAAYVEADKEVYVNRPVNVQGLTGLIFTNSAYTQPGGTMTVGLSASSEDNENGSMAEAAVTGTLALTDTTEIGIKAKIVGVNFGSSSTRETGAGNPELLVKWRFSNQGETMPALAMGLGWIFPTGDTDKGFSEVKYEGIKFMLMAAAENKVLENGLFGAYIDVQAVLADPFHRNSDSDFKERYGVINTGILFGLNEDNSVQFLLEYNRVVKKDVALIYDGSFSGLTPGIRYVTENLNATMGIQFIKREDPSALGANGTKLVLTLGYRF